MYTEEELQINSTPFKERCGNFDDWSTVHQDTGSILDPPNTTEDWQQYKLSVAQVSQYKRDGFLAPIKVLSEEACENLLQDYNTLIDDDKQNPLFYEYHKNQTGDSENVLFHALGHWRITRLFHDLAFHPAISVPASQLLDPSGQLTGVRLWHDQLFGKPAKYGGCVAWHQDFSYWTRTYPMKHLTIHIALDEQTIENGCIHYIPGSHKWTRDGGKPLPVTDFNFKDMESIKTILTEEEKTNFTPIPCLLKRGEASFHHPLAVHGSFPNKSNAARRAAVVNYIADGVKSDTDELLLEGTEVIPKGKELNGQFFPKVFDPMWMNV